MSAFIKNIQNTAHAHQLWSRGSKILVGVSGGPDSICLVAILVFLSKKYDWHLRIAHVNYDLRGTDSAEDEVFVRNLATHYHLPCSVLKPKITEQSNLEEYLRDIRYAFFEKTRQKYAFDTVAVAHTLDDQAETVLMRLIRGSGLSGLRAMQVKTGTIIRPFLETTRESILAYIKQQNLAYRTDHSNTDARFLRNNIRHQLIPYLQKHFNPAIKEVLATTASVIGEDYAQLQSATTACPIPFSYVDQILTFQAHDLLRLTPSSQKMVLREFLRLIRGDMKGITSAHISEVLKMLQSTKSKIKTLSFGGLHIVCTGTTVSIRFSASV